MAQDQSGPTSAPAKRRRWPTVLLAVSLTLNLLVLGVIFGAQFRDERDARRFPPPDRAMMRGAGFAPFFDALPRETRQRMGAALHESGALRPDRAALAREFDALIAALRADPFDPGAIEAVLSRQQARVAGRVAASRAILIEQVGQMPSQARREFADRLAAQVRRDGAGGPHGGARPRGN